MGPDGTVQRTVITSPYALESSFKRPPSPNATTPSERPSTPPPARPHSSVPSSPLSASHNPFSDPQTNRSLSPPSSPPPLKLTPPTAKPHKPAFSFLKRKRAASPVRPLGEISGSTTNARSGPITATNDDKPAAKKAKTKARTFTQMRLDLGAGATTRACAACGMEYVPSNPEDATLHRKFHDKHLRTHGGERGVDLGRGFVQDVGGVPDQGRRDATIVAVDVSREPAVRRKAAAALKVVAMDLGAVVIPEEELWGGGKGVKGKRQADEGKEGGYKVFLYCIEDKCAGVCLTERISKASKVVSIGAEEGSQKGSRVRSSSILTEPSNEPVLLGISRIWTAKAYRCQGIARALLDHARDRFFYGMEVAKEMVAFSQPTESGGHLAEKWYGEAAGWHVYGSM